MNQLELESQQGGERSEIAPKPRVVGPGRRERQYLERVAELEGEGRRSQEQAERLARELEVAERLERGSQRHLDKLERRLDRETERARESEEAQKRLLLALGAVQRDNERLRERLETLSAPAALRLEAAPRPWWARLLGRSPRA